MQNKIINFCYEKFSHIVEENHLFDNIDQFLLLFSCGKDCSVLMDLFLRYGQEKNIEDKISIYSVQFPRHMYYDKDGRPTKNFESIVNYWKKREIEIQYVIPPFEDFPDEDLFGCKTCKRSRKFVIDDYVNRFSGKTGILTGFTMYDSLAYLNMLLLACNYDIRNLEKMPESEKCVITKMLHKMSLREHLPDDKYMIRPILPFVEKEVIDYLDSRNIPYLDTPCKISKYKFKRIYSKALDLYDVFPVTYEGIESFLEQHGIQLNNGGLSFDDVVEDNFFVDC